MRVVTSLLLFIVVTHTPTSAGTSIGIRGGLTFAEARYDPDYDLEVTRDAGAAFGASIQGALNDRETVRIGFEMQYVEKNWHDNWDIMGVSVANEIRTSEASVFPFIVIRPRIHDVSLYCELGPVFGKVVARRGEPAFEELLTLGSMDNYSESSLGMIFGAGVGLLSRRNEVQVGLRYHAGLKNMYDGDHDFIVKTNCIEFTLAYLLTVSGK